MNWIIDKIVDIFDFCMENTLGLIFAIGILYIFGSFLYHDLKTEPVKKVNTINQKYASNDDSFTDYSKVEIEEEEEAKEKEEESSEPTIEEMKYTYFVIRTYRGNDIYCEKYEREQNKIIIHNVIKRGSLTNTVTAFMELENVKAIEEKRAVSIEKVNTNADCFITSILYLNSD